MPKSADSPWLLRPNDLPAQHLIESEPRLADLENNPVFRLIMWRRRVAPFSSALPASPLGWLGLLYPVVLLLKLLFLRDSMTGNILLLAAIAVSFILPFVYKPSVNAKSNKGLLLNIPNVFLVDLNLAGYPIRDIVNGIWGAGIQSYRWSWRRIISAILGICALLLLLSLFSPLAMRFALWILLGFAAGRFVLRRYTESLGLYHMLILIAQDRKDLKVPSKGDSTGCVAALMAFAILPLAILFLATSYFGAQTRVNTVLIYAVYPVCAVILGAAWGRFHAYVIEHDRNIYYRWIEDYVRKIMQQIEAANDTPQP